MVKKTAKGAGRRHRSRRRNLRRRTMKHKRLPKKGGYSPVGPNGGDYGKVPDSYPSQESGALPDSMAAAGVPIGKMIY